MIRKALLATFAAAAVAVPGASIAQGWYGPPPPPPPWAFHHHGWYRPPPPPWAFGPPPPYSYYRPECVRVVRYDWWGNRHVKTRCF